METYTATGWAPITQPPTITGISPTTIVSSGGVVSGWSQQKIVASVNSWGNSSDQFGSSVAMSSDGTRVIVGAPYEDSITNAGAAYIFTYNESTSTWTEEAKLLSSDLAGSDKLGSAVSITGDGTRVIVGAYGEDVGGNSAGAAYIFVYSGGSWSQEAKLMASDAYANDEFGSTVSISGDGTKVIVGAMKEDYSTDQGAVYIFTRGPYQVTWTEQIKLRASDGTTNDYFGCSVAINGDGTKIIVGASQIFAYSDQGAAYIFTYSGGSWTEQIKLQASDGQSDDYFGKQVAMSGDGTKVIVGAQNHDTGGSNAGSAYIFTYSGGSWSQEPKIQASDIEANDRFGEGGVAINGDGTKVIVGATSEDTNGSNAGAVYIFGYNESTSTWSQEAVFRGEAASDEISDDFGVAINGDGTKIIHGSKKHNSYIGAAYIATYNENQIFDSVTQVYTATGGGIVVGSTIQLQGADGTLYNVVDATTPNAAGTQMTFKMGAPNLNPGSEVVTEFPPSAMSSDTSIAGYVASQSWTGENYPFRAFNDSFGSYALMGGSGTTTGYQSNGSGPYVAAPYAPSTQDISGTSHLGQWIQLQIPNPVKLTRAVIGSSTPNYQHGQFVILGSNDNTNWTPLHAGTQDTLNSPSTSYSGGTNVTTLSAGSLEAFIYFRVVIKSKYNSGSNNVRLDNIQFFGVVSGGNADSWVLANQPYKLKINSASGLSGISTVSIGLPVGWTSPAAGANLSFDTTSTTTHTLVGTDGGGGTNRKFEVAPSSPGLPSGLTLTESGVISGTITNLGTTNVTFRLTDIGSGQFTDRVINIKGVDELYTLGPNPFTFTNAGLYGRTGPTFAQMKDAYGVSGWWRTTANFDEISGKQGFQLWTVPSTGTYTIEARGAQGGLDLSGYNYSTDTAPGNGAIVKATFALTKGVKLVLIVAQSPPRGQSYPSGLGGGGASWVLKPGAFTANNDVYLVAGGGGGAGSSNYAITDNPAGSANGAVQGILGAGGAASGSVRSPGGGAGWTSNGTAGSAAGSGSPYYYGLKPSNGALGGDTNNPSYGSYYSDGGFGGGASNGGEASGGGGGASGGRGATSYQKGDSLGGTSYIMPNGTDGATVTDRTFSGNHEGVHGVIIITQN
jgi:hypothetical protein